MIFKAEEKEILEYRILFLSVLLYLG